MRPYSSWEQIAGYFDGDGNISISDLSNTPFKLSLSLIFTDASFEQISMIREFLMAKGIRTSNVLGTSKGTARIIAISRYEMVLATLKNMLPHLYKKAIEAQSAIDYYEGRITGNGLLTVLSQEVEAGRRERRPHKVIVDVPFKFTEGIEAMKEIRKSRLRDVFGRFRAKVTAEDYAAIRREHFERNAKLQELVAKYPKYSKETIRRILGRDRGYVGVKGIGRVNTTDTTIRDPRKAPHG